MLKRKVAGRGEDEAEHRRIQAKHRKYEHKGSDVTALSPISEPSTMPESLIRSRTETNRLQREEVTLGQHGIHGGATKVEKILDALDDILLSDTEVRSSYQEIDEKILSKCRKLRKSFEKHRSIGIKESTVVTDPVTQAPEQHIGRNISSVSPPSSLTPWTSSSIPSTFPPLPAIHSPTLEMAAFTHSGVVSIANALSYERLEWIGDAYLYLIATLLISSTFTNHGPGRCAQIRERLVKNETLASYAEQYGFEKRAKLPPEFSWEAKNGIRARTEAKMKVMGDLFEAYVGAVVLSDPDQGVNRVSAWLKDLWSQTISDQIVDEECRNKKAKITNDETSFYDPKVSLSRKIGAAGIKIFYNDAGPSTKDPFTGLPLFAIGVYLHGWGEVNKQLGFGRALNKREAGAKAAEMALANKEMLSVYEEKKKAYDENLQSTGIGRVKIN